jgi:hypothetical protein
MAWHKLQMQRWSKVHAKDVPDCLAKFAGLPVNRDPAIEGGYPVARGALWLLQNDR